MKNIIDFLNESRGMNLFDRDTYRKTDHTDPLIKNKKTRPKRSLDLKMFKYTGKLENFIKDTNVLNIDVLKDNFYQFDANTKNSYDVLFLHDLFELTISDEDEKWYKQDKSNFNITGNAFSAFAKNISKGNKTVENFMENFLKRDKIMMKYYVEKEEIEKETDNWNADHYIKDPRFMWWLKDGSFGIIFINPNFNLELINNSIKFFSDIHSDAIYVFKKFEKLINKINTEYNERINK